jgi:glycerol-3-phosphate acyltransferase PlsY
MLELGSKVLLSYLLGSLNGSLLIGWIYGVDIRTQGSGNAGGTNALRTQGKLFALLVMIIDVGKGWLPAFFLPVLMLPAVAIDPEVSRTWLMLACAGAAIVGHCYPVWFQFRGGKGAATAIGALLAIAPDLLLPGAAVFAGALILSGYVGLATMSAYAFLPVYFGVTRFSSGQLSGQLQARPVLLFLIVLAAFIVFTHRDNIRRLRAGSEHRHERVMLFRR